MYSTNHRNPTPSSISDISVENFSFCAFIIIFTMTLWRTCLFSCFYASNSSRHLPPSITPLLAPWCSVIVTLHSSRSGSSALESLFLITYHTLRCYTVLAYALCYSRSGMYCWRTKNSWCTWCDLQWVMQLIIHPYMTMSLKGRLEIEVKLEVGLKVQRIYTRACWMIHRSG